jgi:LuxR family maltose regulon positive regulatory protein
VPDGALGKLAPPYFEFEPVATVASDRILASPIFPKLVSVCAPVGYGKTVLLSQLHRHASVRGLRALWLTLDDRDTDLRAVLDLIDLLGGPRDADADAVSAPPPSLDARVDRLVHRLADSAEPTVLFLDNLNFCDDARLALLMLRLVFASGPKLRIVVSSSRAIPVDTTRAKLQFGIAEVDMRQLGFDRPRVVELFARAGLQGLPDEVIETALARTEGWPAALRLLQVLISREGGAAAMQHFRGDDQDIAAVLTRQVLAGFEPQQVTYLVEIATLREFDAELAQAVTGQRAAAEWMKTLLERNVLIFRVERQPTDIGSGWLRMHTLLRQYLLTEGRQLPAERRRAILLAAARTLAAREDPERAIDYALEGSALEFASELLDRVARRVVSGGGWLARFKRWAEHLMAAGMPLGLESHAWYAWSLCFSNRFERARWSIERLVERLEQTPAPPDELRARVGVLQVLTAVFQDRLDDAIATATDWLAQDRAREPFDKAMVACAAAIGYMGQLDVDQAIRHLDAAQAAAARKPGSYGHTWVAVLKACVWLDAGEPRRADALLAGARADAVRTLGDQADIIGTIDLVQARAALDLGDTDRSRWHVAAGLDSATRHGIIETAVQGLSACIALWDGAAEGAFAPAAQEAVALSYPPRAQRLLVALQVRRLARLGRGDDAEEIARRHGLWLRNASTATSDREAVEAALARIELTALHAQTDRALTLIDRQLRQTPQRTRVREAIVLHLMAAELRHRLGDDRRALRHVALALALAAPRGLAGPFDEFGALMTALLSAFQPRDFGFTQSEEIALLQLLYRRFGAAGPATACAATAAPLDAPTPRERELLDLLERGLSNQQIADRSALSVTTVKWHLTNLYAKLGVRSRSAAVTRARALGQLTR